MSKQYVQHISGQGKIYEVRNDRPGKWITADGEWWLDMTEFRLCEPPERWVDVTGECELKEAGFGVRQPNLFHGKQSIFIGSPEHICSGYRLRKVHLTHDQGGMSFPWAFIVEKKVCE